MTNDPFLSDFSQDRVADSGQQFATIQWIGGTPSDSGAWFIEEKSLNLLGLDLGDEPPAGLYRTKARLGGKAVPGWGADALNIAVLHSDFHWEDKETGKLRFPSSEYDRRKREGQGGERDLRGRTIVYAVVKELAEHGFAEPVRITTRGSFSANLNFALKELKRMSAEATKLRAKANVPGRIPPEAFWLELSQGKQVKAGEGSKSSLVHPIQTDVPVVLERDYLIACLVEEPYRRPGGLFDQHAAAYGEAWKGQAMSHDALDEEVLDESTGELTPRPSTPARQGATGRFKALIDTYLAAELNHNAGLANQPAGSGARMNLWTETCEALGFDEEKGAIAVGVMKDAADIGTSLTFGQCNALRKFVARPDAREIYSMIAI